MEKSFRQKTAPVSVLLLVWPRDGGLDRSDSMLGRWWLDMVGATVDAVNLATSCDSRSSRLVGGVLMLSPPVNVRLLLLRELAHEEAVSSVVKLLRRWSTTDLLEISNWSCSLVEGALMVYI